MAKVSWISNFTNVLAVIAVFYAIHAVTQQTADAPPVHVEIYYESRCPFSAAFITTQLAPAYARLGDSVMNITLVPFGNALSIKTPWNRTDYVCQHGVAECLGNNLQGCYLQSQAESLPQNVTVGYIACQMNLDKYVIDLARDCLDQVGGGIDWHPIEQCANDQHVYPQFVDILDKATQARKKFFQGMPFLYIDGVENDVAVHIGFFEAVCAAYTGVKPAACNQSVTLEKVI